MTAILHWSSRTWSTPLADPQYRSAVMDRISRSIHVTASGCWEWQKRRTVDGYGRVSIKRRMAGVHVVTMAVHLDGMWAADLQVDHLCRNRACCNPAHLELVTSQENTRRGIAPILAKERGGTKTHCPRLHPYDETNTYRHPVTGYRLCRLCRALRERERSARKRSGT